MNIVIDIGDMKISENKEDILVTYALGSCLGLVAYDPVTGTGGIIHCMLPLSTIDPEKSKKNPYMFTDTGVTLFLQELLNKGIKKNNLIIRIAGCSRILDEKGLFNIGERNYTVARKILWKNDLLITKEDIGGEKTRTVGLEINTGNVFMKINGETYNL